MSLREVFINHCGNLLDALTTVFPECGATADYNTQFGTLVKGNEDREKEVMEKYHEVVAPFYDACRVRDESVIAEISKVSFLSDLDLLGKWSDPDFHPESKENLWAYIDELNNCASLFFGVPQGMMETIETKARDIAEKIKKGEMNMQDINLEQLGQSIVEGVSQEEMEGFEANLPSLVQNVQNIAGDGMPDISALAAIGNAKEVKK
jgi:hypothetical protein